MGTTAQIFGAQYTFEGEDPERIRVLADYVNRQMTQTAKSIRNVTTSKVAVMAAMSIADELFRLRESVEQATRNNAARLDDLVAQCKRLDSSLEESPRSEAEERD